MTIGGFLKSLFGGGGADGPKEGETVDYEGYAITPAPMPHNGQFLTAGTIRKTVGGEELEHKFIRADTNSSFDEACNFTVIKARQLIDQMGEGLFKQRSD